MKTKWPGHKSIGAMTLIEVVLVLAVICLLGSMFFPRLGSKPKSLRIRCVNNSKQIATAFRVFASDNDNRFPLQATTNQYIYQPGGSGTAAGAIVSTNAAAWQVFQAMWEELQSPKVLLCPADRARANFSGVTNFNGLTRVFAPTTTASLGHPGNRNAAISYAPQALADESRPDAVLIVDRNINFATAVTATNTPGAAAGSRLIVAAPGAASSLFFVGARGYQIHGLEGNIARADGSVHRVTVTQFQDTLTNAGALYGWGAATSNGHGAAVFLMP